MDLMSGNWPSKEHFNEFLNMLAEAGKTNRFVCYEYRDRGTLPTQALKKAITSLANEHNVLLAIDTENAVVVAHFALSPLESEIRRLCAGGDWQPFFIALAQSFPNQVGITRINNDGTVQFVPIGVTNVRSEKKTGQAGVKFFGRDMKPK